MRYPPYPPNPIIMAQSYNMVRAYYTQYFVPDTNPTVKFVPGTKSTQNNASDAWSQGPNGYPGNPPAGLGNTYNQHDPYVVKYTSDDTVTKAKVTEPPLHYRGPIPKQNYNAMLVYAAELAPLRDTYTKEWIGSISPEVAAQLTTHNISQWSYIHNDITPISRNGGRYSQ